MTFKRFLLSLSLAAIAAAANCNTDQSRQAGDPSGQDIADEITAGDSLNNICTGGFPPGNDLVSTWNVGSIVFNVTRTFSNRTLLYCNDAFTNIINQCVSGDNYWGGIWQLNGEVYTISDSDYPAYTLPSDLLTSSASTSSSTPTSSSMTPSSEDATVPAGATTLITSVSGTPITQTYVPTTISGASSTTSSTIIDGVVVPLIIGAGGAALIPFIPVGGVPPIPIDPPIPTPTGNSITSEGSTTTSSSSSSSSSSLPTATQTADEVYLAGPAGYSDAGAAASITYYGAIPSSSESSSTVSSSTAPEASITATESAPTSTCSPYTFADGTYTPALETDCANIIPVDNTDIAVTDINNCQIYPDDMQMVCTFYVSGACAVLAGWQISSIDPLTPPAKVHNNQLADRYNSAMSKTQNGCTYDRQAVSGNVYGSDGSLVEQGLTYTVCVSETGTKCFYLPLQ